MGYFLYTICLQRSLKNSSIRSLCHSRYQVHNGQDFALLRSPTQSSNSNSFQRQDLKAVLQTIQVTIDSSNLLEFDSKDCD